jgi:septal ring factor EnvC (AmiA/AmiB activator)
MPDRASSTHRQLVWPHLLSIRVGRGTTHSLATAAMKRPAELVDTERARLVAELMRAQSARRSACAARNAAELARGHAERERDAAEAGSETARQTIAVLEEQVAYLQEQVRSNRDYLSEVVEADVADLRAERAALVRESATLNEELLDRAR